MSQPFTRTPPSYSPPRRTARDHPPDKSRSATYGSACPTGAATDSFALIALLPNLANNGKVLFIEGLTMEGTDAACEFLLNPQSCDLLVRRIASEMGSMKPFEALLQLTPVSGDSANIRLIRLSAPFKTTTSLTFEELAMGASPPGFVNARSFIAAVPPIQRGITFCKM